MIRRHPRPTRTDTLVPYTTRVRSTEGAAGAGGRGRDLDEGPQGERPDEQADRLRQGIPVLRRGGDQGGDRAGVERHQRGEESGRQNRSENPELDRAVRLGPGIKRGNDLLERAGCRHIYDFDYESCSAEDGVWKECSRSG